MDELTTLESVLQQAPVVGVFAYFAYLNWKQTVKTLDFYQKQIETTLVQIANVLAVLEERTRDKAKANEPGGDQG